MEATQFTKHNYCEFSTCLPFFELFYEQWESDPNDLVIDETINSLAKLLSVSIDQKVLENAFQGTLKRIDVFHAVNNPEVFAYFDNFKDPTDQNDMIYFAVRCLRTDEDKVFELFHRLYAKSSPRCNLQIDLWNQSNYNRVFNSNFYIKKQPKYSDREIFRYGLKS